MPEPESEDRLLGGRVRLRQPKSGYRVAIDPVLLAASVPAKPGDSVLDLGTGVGAVALCLAARVPGLDLTGLELERDFAELARLNAALNRINSFVVIEGSIAEPPAALQGRSFDHVAMNPPFLEPERASPVAKGLKSAATVEAATLASWLELALARAGPKGAVTLIHRADRLAEILRLIEAKAGAIAVLPLWPKPGRPAKRVIVQARRGSKAALRLLPGLVLHREDGRFTPEAEAVLRDGEPISLA